MRGHELIELYSSFPICGSIGREAGFVRQAESHYFLVEEVFHYHYSLKSTNILFEMTLENESEINSITHITSQEIQLMESLAAHDN